MSKIVPIRPTRRSVVTAHRVTFDLVPRAVVEALFTMAGDRRDAKATPSGEVNTN